MAKFIFGISGEIGAGKDTAKEYLVTRYNAKSLGFSMILKDILDRLYLPAERAKYANLAEALRNTFGENILATVIAEDARQSSASMVVIDGIRKFGELEELQKLSNFHFLFVDTDLRVRYDRIRARGMKVDDTTKTFEEFVRDHEHAADREVRELKNKADITLENNGTLEDLHGHIEEILQRLKK